MNLTAGGAGAAAFILRGGVHSASWVNLKLLLAMRLFTTGRTENQLFIALRQYAASYHP